jgi:stage III sporulation protein AE
LDQEGLRQALPSAAQELLQDREVSDTEDVSASVSKIITNALENGSIFKTSLALCIQIFAVVLLSAVLRGAGGDLSAQAMTLAGVLAIGAICVGRVSGFFTQASQTVDDMTAFAGFLYGVLASATAATGAVGTSTALYGGTVLLCSLMSRTVQSLFLPGISCYMALMVADSALPDGGLKLAGDTLKQLLTGGLKLCVLAMTAYLSLTGVIRGSADTAAVKAAKLAISTTVPVVGSMIADASETLLVSAGLLRSGAGIFGLLGVLAVSVTPVVSTGTQYLLLKTTAAVSALVGEKELSGLIGGMAGALGLLTALTGACAVLLMVGCVCFMKASL